jgi:hypothetical protein
MLFKNSMVKLENIKMESVHPGNVMREMELGQNCRTGKVLQGIATNLGNLLLEVEAKN